MSEHAVKTCALKSWDGIGKAAVTASWRPPLHCRRRKRESGGDGQQLDKVVKTEIDVRVE